MEIYIWSIKTSTPKPACSQRQKHTVHTYTLRERREKRGGGGGRMAGEGGCSHAFSAYARESVAVAMSRVTRKQICTQCVLCVCVCVCERERGER